MASSSRARSATVTGTVPHMDSALPHGGDVAAARRLFPGAPEPFADLSTGINPHAYPLPPFPPEVFARLPAPDDVARRAVVAAPGTQILLPLVAALVPPGRAAVRGPTYGEFARAAALAGHRVTET